MNDAERLLSQLPGVFHPSVDLRKLLAALEKILLAGEGRALEAEIAALPALLDVVRPADEMPPWLADARDEFLPWLSQWVALSHGLGLPAARLRQLIGVIVPLYAWRGTKRYLADLLKFFLPEHSEIQIEDQQFVGLVVGRARVGTDTWLEQDRPFWFKVTLRLPASELAARREEEWRKPIVQIIDLAKPAHTTYGLDLALAQMEAGVSHRTEEDDQLH